MTVNATPKTATRGRKPAKKAGKRKGSKSSTNPSRTKTPMGQGIYIPASRVKRYLDSAGLNKRIEDAIAELRDAEPHDVEEAAYVKNDVTGKLKKVVTGVHRTELKTFNQLSEFTRNMIAEAKTANDEREKAVEKAEKSLQDRLRLMSADERKRHDEREAAKAAEDAAKAAAVKAKAAQLAEDIKDGKVDVRKYPVRGPKKTTKYSSEIELLSKMRVRFSKDASQQLAATICAMVHERTKFSIENCLKHELKIVKVRHAIEKGHDLLDFASLIRNLPAYRGALVAEEQRAADEVKVKEEKKAAKKAAREGETAVVEPAAAVADDDDEDDDASFGHYVRQVAHNVMNTELQAFVPRDKKTKHPYEDIRISAEYRDWMSEVIIEFIRRFCPLLNGQIRTMGIKTISRDIIRQTVNIHLEIYGVDTVVSNQLFDEKFDLYQVYTQKRKGDKESAKKPVDVKLDSDDESDDESDTEDVEKKEKEEKAEKAEKVEKTV